MFYAEYSVYDNITDSAQRWSNDDITVMTSTIIGRSCIEEASTTMSSWLRWSTNCATMEQYNVPVA